MEVSALKALGIDELRSRLSAALDAQHELLTGVGVVEIHHQRGSRTRFSEANADQLDRYIANLHAAITACESGRTGRRGPIYLGVC